MRRTITMMLMAVALLLTAMVGTAAAHGVTADRVGQAGFTCADLGPIGVHCFVPAKGKSTPVLVFESSEHGALLGTELLLAPDVYGGQPCPQEDEQAWGLPLGPDGPRACHHYG